MLKYLKEYIAQEHSTETYLFKSYKDLVTVSVNDLRSDLKV